jgi:hypothetical protein
MQQILAEEPVEVVSPAGQCDCGYDELPVLGTGDNYHLPECTSLWVTVRLRDGIESRVAQMNLSVVQG